MERRTDIKTAERIMGNNFIGPEALEAIKEKLNIKSPYSTQLNIPLIEYNAALLEKYAESHLLILGFPYSADGKVITINRMRYFFGTNPNEKEPCFYNQDWYINEPFAKDFSFDFRWYLLKKDVHENSRGENPDKIIRKLQTNYKFPTAILAAYTFFSYYFLTNGNKLWENDYIWCEDKDQNGDMIYVGRYIDSKKNNMNGFSIHRLLTIRKNYSYVNLIS